MTPMFDVSPLSPLRAQARRMRGTSMASGARGCFMRFWRSDRRWDGGLTRKPRCAEHRRVPHRWPPWPRPATCRAGTRIAGSKATPRRVHRPHPWCLAPTMCPPVRSRVRTAPALPCADASPRAAAPLRASAMPAHAGRSTTPRPALRAACRCSGPKPYCENSVPVRARMASPVRFALATAIEAHDGELRRRLEAVDIRGADLVARGRRTAARAVTRTRCSPACSMRTCVKSATTSGSRYAAGSPIS